MIIYQLLYITILIQIFLKNKIINKILMLLMLLIAGTRIGVGHDYGAYKFEIFKQIPSSFGVENFSEIINKVHGEILFKYIIVICKYLKMNSDEIFFVISIITIGILFKYFKNTFGKNIEIPMYIYISFYYMRDVMGIIRYGLATVIILYSIKYIHKKKLITFILCVFIATMIQSASIFFITAYFIKDIKFRLKWKTIILIIILLTNHLNILYYILTNIKFMYFHKTIANYMNQMNNYNRFGLYQIYLIATFYFFSYFFREKNKMTNLYVNLYVIGVFLYFIFFKVATFSDRISGVFLKSSIYLYTMVYFSIKKKSNKIIFLILLIILSSYFYEREIYKNIEVYVPYKSWMIKI